MIQHPEKVFPCDCCGEGLIITIFDDCGDGFDDPATVAVARDGKQEDEHNYFILGISFWGEGNYSDGRLSWRDRLRLMWYVWRHGHPWADMVEMRPDVAKNFANHILYRVGQMQKKIDHKRDELKEH